MEINMRTPSVGNMYRVFLLTSNDQAVMKDIATNQDRKVYEAMSTFTLASRGSHVAAHSKAMAIFDMYGKLVFGKIDPSVEQKFEAWVKTT